MQEKICYLFLGKSHLLTADKSTSETMAAASKWCLRRTAEVESEETLLSLLRDTLSGRTSYSSHAHTHTHKTKTPHKLGEAETFLWVKSHFYCNFAFGVSWRFSRWKCICTSHEVINKVYLLKFRYKVCYMLHSMYDKLGMTIIVDQILHCSSRSSCCDVHFFS